MKAAQTGKNSLLFVFVSMLCLLAFTSVSAWRANHVYAESGADVAAAQNELETTANLLAQIADSETAAFGYFLSGDQYYLQTFDKQFDAQLALVEKLRGMTADDPHEQQLFGRTALSLKARRNELDILIRMRQTQGLGAVQARVLLGTGRSLLGTVKSDLTAFQQAEQKTLSSLIHRAQADASHLNVLILVCCLLVIATAVLTGLLYRQDQRRRNADEKMLRDAQVRFQAAFDGAPIGMCLVDTHGFFFESNVALTRLSGYSVAELREINFAALTHPEDVEDGLQQLNTILNRQQDSYTREARQIHKDGHVVWVRISVTVVRDQAGKPQYFIAQIEDVSEQRRINRMLAATAVMLERTSQIARIGGWEIDVATMQSVWSRETYRIHDMDPDVEADLSHAIDLFPPDARATVDRYIQRSLEFGEGYEFELPKFTATGRLIWVHSIGNVEIDDGKVVRLYGTIQDITARRERDLALKQLSERLSLATRSMGLGIWEMDMHTQVLIWDDALYAMYDIDPGAADQTYSMWRSRIHPDDLADTERRIADAIEHSTHFEGRFRIIRRDGQVRWIYAAAVVRLGENGIPQQLIGVNRDITTEVNAEIEVEAGRIKLQCIIDAAADFSIIATDLDGMVELFSLGAERLLGYRADEIVQKTSPALFHVPDEVQQRAEQLTQALGRPVAGFATFTELAQLPRSEVADVPAYMSTEWTYVRKDGERIPVSLVMSVLYGTNGEAIGYLSVAKDIRIEQANRHAMANALASAQQASVAKSQFLANMSHEIRTPMNAILGMVQLLQQTDLTPRQRDYADKTRTAAQSLLGILNDILDFSKVEAGKLELDIHPFAPESLLSNLSVILASSLGKRPVELVFDIDPALPAQLHGDALRLQQVLINLTGNALKFTERGTVCLRLAVVAQDAASVELEISVHDSGIGIAADQLGPIFEGFSQAEASTTRRFGGTGLGLAISQHLVTLMGGRLEAESTVGEGSRFYFRIQLGYDGGAAHYAVLPIPNGTALLIEDHAAVRQQLGMAIERLGWKCVAVSSAAAAVEWLAECQDSTPHVDLIVMDGTLPDVDTWPLAVQLRRLTHQKVPVMLMLTAHQREALSADMAATPDEIASVVVKPLTDAAFYEGMRQALVGTTETSSTRVSKRQRLAGLRLLVVEDNPMNQQVARELLQSEGASVEVAGGGTAGVAAIQRGDTAFDAVLMDIQMPDMDGYTATQLIREGAVGQTVPIIAMTANAMQSDRDACLAAGMNDHIGKPIDLDIVVHTVLRYCGLPLLAAEPTPAQHPAESIATTSSDIELAAALQRLGGDADLYLQLAETFMGDAALMMSDLVASLQQQDDAAAIRYAHTLKSMAATVGAVPFRQCAADVEQALKQSNTHANADEISQRLQTSFARCRDALMAVMTDLNGS